MPRILFSILLVFYGLYTPSLSAQSRTRSHYGTYTPPQADEMLRFFALVENQVKPDQMDNPASALKKVDATIAAMRKQIKRSKGTAKEKALMAAARLLETKAFLERQMELKLITMELQKASISLVPMVLLPEKKIRSDRTFTSAAEMYQALVNEFPRSPSIELALLHLSTLLIMSGNENVPLYIKQMLTLNPKGRAQELALLVIGEFYFSKKDWGKAATYFQQAGKTREPDIKAYLQYKEAWLNWLNPANPIEARNKSLMTLKVLSDAVPDKANAEANPKEAAVKGWLAEESSNDVVWLFGQMGVPAKAKAALEKSAPDLYGQALMIMAAEAFKRNDSTGFKLIAATIQNDLPTYPRKYASQTNLLLQLEKEGNHAALIKEIDSCAQLFQADSAWSKHNAGNKQIGEYQNLVANELEAIADRYLKGKPGIDPKASQAIAEHILEFLLKHNQPGDRILTTRLKLAVVLEKQNKLSEAVVLYDTMLQDKKLPEEIREIASQKMLPMAELNAAADLRTIMPPAGQPLKKQELPLSLKYFNKAVAYFIDAYPDHARNADLSFTVGHNLAKFGQNDEAVAQLRSVGKSYPLHAAGDKSKLLLLDLHDRSQNWKQMQLDCEQFLKVKKFNAPQTSDTIIAALKKSIWKQAEVAQQQKNSAPAADFYLQYQARFPSDPKAGDALHFAFGILLSLGKTQTLVKATDLINERYSQHPKRSEMLRQTAQIYENTGQYGLACTYLKLYIDSLPKQAAIDKEALKILQLMTAEGQLDDALVSFELLAQRNSKLHSNPEISLLLARIYISLKQPAKATPHLAKLETSNDASVRARAASMMYTIYRLNQNFMQANKSAENLINFFKKQGSGAPESAINSVNSIIIQQAYPDIYQLNSFDFAALEQFDKTSQKLEQQITKVETQLQRILPTQGNNSAQLMTSLLLAKMHHFASQKYHVQYDLTLLPAAQQKTLANKKEQLMLSHRIKMNDSLNKAKSLAAQANSYNLGSINLRKFEAELASSSLQEELTPSPSYLGLTLEP